MRCYCKFCLGELRVQGFAYPSDTVYVGGNVKLFCCINIDPRSFVPEDGVCSKVFAEKI